jgi:putative membrane protein
MVQATMTLRWILAAVHLLGLGIGLGAIWARARALRGTLDAAGLRRVFTADAFWGVAALIWVTTGLWRAFGGVEKGTAYYVGNPVFLTKMGLFGLILALEVRPIVTLTKWRARERRGDPVDTSTARMLALTSEIQVALVVLIVLMATALARGIGS